MRKVKEPKDQDPLVEYVVIEYLEPISPANRRVFEPVEGLGPVVFWARKAGFDAYYPNFPAWGTLRVIPAEVARKCRLM